jgi:cell division transport system permease protein
MTDDSGMSEKSLPASRDRGASAKPVREQQRYNLRSGRNIVPREGVAGQALAVVIAIMAFLASLTFGAVASISDTAARWQTEIAREVTVQIKPVEGRDMEATLREASRLLLTFEGVTKATALDPSQTARLLEPWLGKGLDINELPVPRLITLEISRNSAPDYAAIRSALEEKVPGATLDDHGAWLDRLVAMAWTTVVLGAGILILVLVATALIVVFATRGAMAGNREIVEVLHFVGADSRFIAREFQRHFLMLAFRGATAGGVAATLIFIAFGLWSGSSRATPQGDQISALFGNFSIGLSGFAGIAAIVGLIAFMVAATSRHTVMRHVGGLERAGIKARDG